MSPILQNSPRIWVYTQFHPLMLEKVTKSTSKQLQFGFKVFLLPIALPQGQLTEVPIYFKVFTIKVVGQTILAWSTTKTSKLQSNGIIKLGLVKSVVLYCNLTPHELQKCKLKLVTDFQCDQMIFFKTPFFSDKGPPKRQASNMRIKPINQGLILTDCLKRQAFME